LFRRPAGDDFASIRARLWAKINNVIGLCDHAEIVLDDNHRVSFVDEPMQHAEKQFNVGHVQTDRGFLEQIQCRAWLAHLADPLVGRAADTTLKLCD
jgi:hypothetical protein